jgi:hypothetical protein
MENSRRRVMYRKVHATANVRFRESIRPLCVCSKDGSGTDSGHSVELSTRHARLISLIVAEIPKNLRNCGSTGIQHCHKR